MVVNKDTIAGRYDICPREKSSEMTSFVAKLAAPAMREGGRRSRVLKALASRGSRTVDFYFDADAYDRRAPRTDQHLPLDSLILAYRI